MGKESIPIQKIAPAIFVLRGQKVILSQDLAALYGVTVGALTQAVKRNPYRFPKDFVFQLTAEEFRNLKSQIVISSWGGRRHLPYAFTEQGVAMLSSVLNGQRAVKVNIAIMRAFVKLRETLETNRELAQKFAELEKRVGECTHLACWRWHFHHRELPLRCTTSALSIRSRRHFPARRREGHARRVCSLIHIQ
ncbi:MAG: DNA-binding protein [Acidobacteria bacterium]|nr:MAG: DNA-binding protein [Acidobacteriota bacterium]